MAGQASGQGPRARDQAARSLGHEVTEAADGESALAVAREKRGIGLLVTDLELPGLPGDELGRLPGLLIPGAQRHELGRAPDPPERVLDLVRQARRHAPEGVEAFASLHLGLEGVLERAVAQHDDRAVGPAAGVDEGRDREVHQQLSLQPPLDPLLALPRRAHLGESAPGQTRQGVVGAEDPLHLELAQALVFGQPIKTLVPHSLAPRKAEGLEFAHLS